MLIALRQGNVVSGEFFSDIIRDFGFGYDERSAMLTGAYRFPAMESVIYGRPFAEALKEEVERADAHAVFLLASGTLSRETDMVEQIRSALGNRFAGVHSKIGSHTPRVDCVAAANAAQAAAGADLIVTLGGGSVTSTRRRSSRCAWRTASSTRPQPRRLPRSHPGRRRQDHPAADRGAAKSAQSAIPTTLSRPASTPPRPAAPTPRATSRKATAIR